MRNLDLLNEVAALGGYSISSGTGQDAINKARAQRRLNMIKADIISRYGGKWDANYREGWLPIIPNYSTGTVMLTVNSNTVTGSGTFWTSVMKGRKFIAPDGSQYQIATVVSTTSIFLTQPYQGASVSGASYTIWKDEYVLFPEALTIGGFINYNLPTLMSETWPRNMKDSYPNATQVSSPTVYTIIGREALTTPYTTGTVSGTINTNILTGVGTTWNTNTDLSRPNMVPGMELTIGAYKYHVKRVNSDTELELYQLLIVAVSGSTYSAVAKNSLKVRFSFPASQMIVGYWYWAKDYPFLNDSDEDWIAETYPKVVINGILYYDYIDKNDIVRGQSADQKYQKSIEEMKVAVDGAYTGARTIGYYLPDNVRD